eukprot:gene18406-13236_t
MATPLGWVSDSLKALQRVSTWGYEKVRGSVQPLG